MTVFVLFFVKKVLLGLIVEIVMTIYCLKQRRWLLWFLATYFITIHCILVIFPLTIYVVYVSDYILAVVLFFKYANLSEKAENILVLLSIFLFLWLSGFVLFGPIVSNTYRFTEINEKEEYIVIQKITSFSHFAQEGTRMTGYIYKDSYITPVEMVQHNSPLSGKDAMLPELPKNSIEIENYLRSGEKIQVVSQ